MRCIDERISWGQERPQRDARRPDVPTEAGGLTRPRGAGLATGRPLGQPQGVTEIANAQSFADHPGAFLPWLVSVWRDLRRLVAEATATKQERELLHLVEYAASHHGGLILSASDLDDLDDRLDELLGDPAVWRWNALAMPLALGISRSVPLDPAVFAESTTSALGLAQARELEASAPLLTAWLETQRAALVALPEEVANEAASALDAMGPRLLTSPEVPPEVAAALEGGLRAGLCTLAIARAIEQGGGVEPWLARGLVDRFLAGVRAHLRLLAAFSGADVPVDVLPAHERLDMHAITERHGRARAQAARIFETGRRRLEGDA